MYMLFKGFSSNIINPALPAKSDTASLRCVGYVDIVRKSKTNTNQEVHIIQLTDNSFFGENSFITGDHTRNASVRAGTYCDLMRLEHEDLEELATVFPDFEDSVKICTEEKTKSFRKHSPVLRAREEK